MTPKDVYAAHPEAKDWVNQFSALDTAGAETVVAPEDLIDDVDGEGYWAGAPTVCEYDDTLYLAFRERDPVDRGRRMHIYEIDDDAYTPVTSFTAKEFDGISVERSAFTQEDDSLRMYVPVDYHDGTWSIKTLDAVNAVDALDPDTARDAVTPTLGASDAYTVKDPVVVEKDGMYHMFYAGEDEQSEQAHHAVSGDGEQFVKTPGPALPRQGWHDHHTRITAAEPITGGWMVTYDGAGADDYGKTWNLRTGVGFVEELGEPITDLTPEDPLHESPAVDAQEDVDTAFKTLRYAALTDDSVYFEMARDDGVFELRRAKRA